ncbi:MAG: dTDP-4-dehydrorhamnose reductase [Lentisphaerae bacterium]|nr:dTDP-4-dehydrorhamnose reductase [Lentisphaerota bacterium]MCP4100649.1 dTDP-4-dehydrorhamnose reductase [Lentisphaerota bacterium]
MSKIALIGANGMLGYDVRLAAQAAGWQIMDFDLPDFDITKPEDIERAVKNADCIVNCAAFTNVDKAESEPEIAAKINAASPGELGKIARNNNKFVVHISTDFVYGDLTDTPQSEDTSTNPLSVYGQTKLDGEKNLIASGCDCAIMRIQWSYGINGMNFITKLAQLAASRPELKVVNDQFGAPTCTADMAQAILTLLDKRQKGLFNFAADGYTSRYETALLIAEKLGLKTKISPCSSNGFPMAAKRPMNSKFNCSKIDNILDYKRPEWQSSLEAFLLKWRDKILSSN